MKDALIIGGGPAGMTAALYLLRAGRSVLILEREAFGGQIARSPRLENFPSIKEISGIEFTNDLFEQIVSLGAEFDLAEVNGITKENGHYVVLTNYGNHEAKSVIIATGCTPRHLGLAKEEKFVGHGISYCAVCDGAFFVGEDAIVIGDGNSALQYAIMLSKTCKKIYLCTLLDRFFGDPILIERVGKIENIEVKHKYMSKKLLGEDCLTGVVFEDLSCHQDITINAPACFVAIGQKPNNERFANLVSLKDGFIKTDDELNAGHPGLYAIGDCRIKTIRQAITATCDGAIAATADAAYLSSID